MPGTKSAAEARQLEIIAPDADLVRVGRDVERVTLARAVRSQLEDRVVVHEGRRMVL
jgi:formyltetrahydrofolate hydrolase